MSHQQRLFELDEPPPWEADDERERLVATVVIPDGPPQPLDYVVPESLRGKVAPGVRLRLPLGRGNRQVVGYCVSLAPAVDSRRLKEVAGVVDERPLLSPGLIELTRWLADYYLCSWSEAIEGAVPAVVRQGAGTRELLFLTVPPQVVMRLDQQKLTRRQRDVLTCLAGSPQPLTVNELAELAGCPPASVQTLRKRGLITGLTRRVQLDPTEDDSAPAIREAGPTLNDSQQAALELVLSGIREGQPKTTLLHGVTGSGKTEIYIRAIEEVITHGKQAIVLVPEISLTPQTRQRFRSRFSRVAVLHSHQSGPERHWHWQRIAEGRVQVIVGARSAVFAPTQRLGLIVIDEEHDGSFKQDSTPRYHAREVAMWRARREGAALVLGSATPSLESLHRAQRGHYQLAELPDRVLGRALPDVGIVDLRVPQGRRAPRGALSRPLLQAMRQALDDGGKVILLLNRRGFSTTIQCTACGEVVKCPDCDQPLTHHRDEWQAVCHYCDYRVEPPQFCPHCTFDGIRYSGLGTERLEAEVRARFPNVESLRMDSDTMRRQGSHERALAQFRDGAARILLGTQMIAKGLDFPDVTLVGVVNADTSLHLPDFRAGERTFQLVTQVAGRTGRGARGGRVLVQTFSPEHPAIVCAQRHDYQAFADYELPQRREHHFPPFGALLRLVVRGPSESATRLFIEEVASRLRDSAAAGSLPVQAHGPAPAPLPKLRGRYRFHLLLVGRRETLRELVRDSLATVQLPDEIQWIVDVDPMDMM